MAIITMYLKYQDDDLHYSLDNENFKLLEEDTVTGVNSGDTFRFELTENSNIVRINDITVNELKSGNRNWMDIWEEKPKAINMEKTIFEGIIKSGLDDDPKFNGYTIRYKSVNGDRNKDPQVQQPPPPEEDGIG